MVAVSLLQRVDSWPLLFLVSFIYFFQDIAESMQFPVYLQCTLV